VEPPPRQGADLVTQMARTEIKVDVQAPFHCAARAVMWASAAFVLLGWPIAGLAQDAAKVKAGLTVWQNSGCEDCHGPFADGNKANDDSPTGANLRASKLDAAGLKLTIGCGRPGAEMPAFDAGAYTARACYGRPLGAAPDNLYPASHKLTPDEIDAVVAYLQARVVGRGDITRDECLFYYDGRSDACDDYQ
jgi:mono/diheme cytochrome c family protein